VSEEPVGTAAVADGFDVTDDEADCFDAAAANGFDAAAANGFDAATANGFGAAATNSFEAADTSDGFNAGCFSGKRVPVNTDAAELFDDELLRYWMADSGGSGRSKEIRERSSENKKCNST
jgi:hypothetical protein